MESLTPQALGTLDLQGLGPHIGISFKARKLARPRVLWLNRRWFREQGISLRSSAERADIEDWLLSRYAAIVPDRYDPPAAFGDVDIELSADRYGAPGGAPNGGSGRCGYAGAFNAKGIGKTPLVSPESDWYHSHGCLWVEEAVREAIAAEVMAAELPYGAVPVVAILDAGLRVHGPDTGIGGARRAILVRPNFLRLAHLERSIRFGRGGTPSSEQYVDELRVQDAVRRLAAHWSGVAPLGGQESEGFEDSFRRIARQVGAGWASRLYHGGLYTSNVCVDGQMVDFGNSRSVPDWRRHICGGRGAAYGAELATFLPAIQSLSFYVRRHAPSLHFDATAMHTMMERESVWAFQRQGLDGIGLARWRGEPLFASAGEVLLRIFCTMQEQQVRNQDGGSCSDWNAAWRCLRGGAATGAAPAFQHIAQLGRLLCRGLGKEEFEHVLCRAAYWLRPRRLLERDWLVHQLSRLSEAQDFESPHFGPRVQAFVDRVIVRSRRSWPELGPDAVVLAAASIQAGTALILRPEAGAPAEVHLLTDLTGPGEAFADEHASSWGGVAIRAVHRHGRWARVAFDADVTPPVHGSPVCAREVLRRFAHRHLACPEGA